MAFFCLALTCVNLFAAASGKDLDLTPEELQWLREHPEISVAFDGHFPPYSFLNDDGQFEGLSVDLFRLIGKKLGVSFNIHPENEWKSLYRAAQRREVDVVATMVNRAGREQWFGFSDPYVFKALVVITLASDERIKSRDDIKGKALALVKDYQYVKKILEDYPSATPYYVDNMLDALRAVSVGNADAAITFLGAGHYYRNKYLMTNLKYAAVYDDNNSNESIAVRKDWPELVSILNKTLKSIPEHKMLKLRDRWLPVDYMESLVEIDLTDAEQQWIKDHRTIRLGVDPEFAPFEYIDQQTYQGIASDYVKILNQRLNLNMEVVEGVSWEEVIDKAKRQEIDVLPAVGITEERREYLNYTQPYLSFHRVIVTRDDRPFISGLGDLDAESVAVQADSSHHGYLNEHSDIAPILYPTLQESLLAVSGGEVDAFVGNVASATYWIRKLNLTNLKIAAPVSTDVQSLHFAVRKDWPELASILQKGLDTISPRLRKNISEKWLALKYEPVVDFSLVWKIIALFSIMLIAFVLWNVLLKRQVRQRTSELVYSANYDQLTDLPNRFLVMDRLLQSINEAARHNEKVALLSIDLDDFKKANDAFGHKAGDTLLKEAACRLRQIVPKNGTVGRLGGDHFLVILGCFTDASDVAFTADKILKSLRQSFDIGNNEISLTASLGISLFPDDGTTPEALLKHADSATHYSKEQRQGLYTFYTEGLIQKVSRRLELEQHMRGALKRNEFQVFYQPKVNAASRKIIGFEALLRWFSRELGAVSPAEFIPVAEQSGLIGQIENFVLKEALATLSDWQTRYATPFSMAINLSPTQFRIDDLVPQIESAILNSGVDSKTLEFEITEGVLLGDYPGVEAKLKQLETLGVTLAMDDFGKGYSSLSYLRRYKFNTLKIDREFITDLALNESDRKLVSAAIAMAHGLGMRVVAEGVETEEQYSILIAQRCDILQGWLFSKALAPVEIKALLDDARTETDRELDQQRA